MHKFTVPAREDVYENNKLQFDHLQKALGFVPNLYAMMAHSENALGKYLVFQGSKSSFSNKEKEAINLVVSQVNDCRYCQSAHTVLGKMNGFSEEEILSIRKGKSSDPKLTALVSLAQEITEKKGRVPEVSLNGFFNAGYTSGHLVDLILQISDKIAMNYLHNISNIPIDFPLAPEL